MLFHRREGRGEQSSLACKEICTETSRCEPSCFWQGKKGVVLHDHLRPFQEVPKESYQLVEDGRPMSPLKHSHHKSD